MNKWEEQMPNHEVAAVICWLRHTSLWKVFRNWQKSRKLPEKTLVRAMGTLSHAHYLVLREKGRETDASARFPH